jgi:acyl-CoA thioester hydrolase
MTDDIDRGTDLKHRDHFRFLSTDTVRYADLDPQGHVNNVAFAVFFESGRVAWGRKTLALMRQKDDGVVTAKLSIDFLGEMHYPGTVEIGTRLLSIGRTSVTLGQGLFQDGQCRATAVTVVVLFDLATRRPKPLSPAAIGLLEAMIRDEATPNP